MRTARRMLGVGSAAVAVATALLAAPAATAATHRVAPADVTDATPVCSSTPFTANAATSTWYRIPAIVRTRSGALLAFAERRDSKAPSSDTGVTQIVEARSTDDGCTWTAPAVIASDGDATVGNPSPVVTADGTVLLFSIDRPHVDGVVASSFHGLHMQKSTDDGVTFSAYSASHLDLGTPDTLRFKGWKGGLTGPGHALLLTSGPHAGRIVVPMFFFDGSSMGASDITSDDSGATWRVGYASTGKDSRMEGTLAQLAGGDLWLSYHTASSATAVGKSRSVAISNDGGESVTTGFRALKLPLISVQASSLVVQSGPYAGELLLSSPGRPDITRRQQMTIFVAHDVTASNPSGTYWSRYPVGLDDTPASYSDLVQVSDSTVGVLYETGHDSWHEKIAFVSMRIAALTAGPTVPATATLSAPKSVWHGHVVVVAKVAVPGTSSPTGTVTVTLQSAHHRYRTTLAMAHDASSKRVAIFDGVAKGKYTVQVRYNGTPRIETAVSKPWTLRVKA